MGIFNFVPPQINVAISKQEQSSPTNSRLLFPLTLDGWVIDDGHKSSFSVARDKVQVIYVTSRPPS